MDYRDPQSKLARNHQELYPDGDIAISVVWNDQRLVLIWCQGQSMD